MKRNFRPRYVREELDFTSPPSTSTPLVLVESQLLHGHSLTHVVNFVFTKLVMTLRISGQESDVRLFSVTFKIFPKSSVAPSPQR